jgi:hypothetical protein
MKDPTIKRLKNYFENETKIIALYLFGSRARERERADSDYDLGILFDFSVSFKERYEKIIRYAGELEGICKVDLVDMNSADYPLLYEIFENGLLLIDRNRDARVQFQAVKMSQYMDYQYFEKIMQEEIIRRAKGL